MRNLVEDLILSEQEHSLKVRTVMATKRFGKLPEGASKSIQPFTIDFPQSDLDDLKTLLKLSRVAGPVHENSLPGEDRHLGVRREWLIKAKKHWETSFDW